MNSQKWVRSRKGIIGGVCQGLGERLGFDPVVARVLWIVSIFIFGAGLLAYVILWWTLPREDRTLEEESGKILGVCPRLARRLGLEVGFVRALAVFSLFASFGSSILAYLALYFVLPPTEVA